MDFLKVKRHRVSYYLSLFYLTCSTINEEGIHNDYKWFKNTAKDYRRLALRPGWLHIVWSIFDAQWCSYHLWLWYSTGFLCASKMQWFSHDYFLTNITISMTIFFSVYVYMLLLFIEYLMPFSQVLFWLAWDSWNQEMYYLGVLFIQRYKDLPAASLTFNRPVRKIKEKDNAHLSLTFANRFGYIIFHNFSRPT